MKRSIVIICVSLLAILGGGCSSEAPKYKVSADAPLQSESDSLAYIIGMNVARELEKMDSLINYQVVCRAIIEHSQGKLLMSDEVARTEYLRYLLHIEPERQRTIEERYLADLALNDRSYTRTKSGLTYNIAVIGDEKLQPKAANDWLTISYYISRINGDVIYPQQSVEDGVEIERVEEIMALSDLPAGLDEAVKMIGVGGQIKMWMPSKLAYGEEGDSERGIAPHETTYYDIKLVDMERNSALKHKVELF